MYVKVANHAIYNIKVWNKIWEREREFVIKTNITTWIEFEVEVREESKVLECLVVVIFNLKSWEINVITILIKCKYLKIIELCIYLPYFEICCLLSHRVKNKPTNKI